MSYTALYRKYRPTGFSGVIGQEHIVRTLQNQINSDMISHAYLFCGTRGTGKTSVAKIFARAVNCESPQNGEPCGVCGFCAASTEQASMVIFEIDAASNNGVENIRDIIDTVKYPPTLGKLKVYIIDEAHMLSMGASNALLKTLEEPPEHTVFILATTEPHKIPPTIHSRCQRFDFRRIPVNEMSVRLNDYMRLENVSIDENALVYIAKISDGAMRDALSILDQCMSFYYGEHISLDKVLNILGSVGSDILFWLANAVHAKDSMMCLNIIDQVFSMGKDIPRFVGEFVEHLRNLLVASSVGTNSAALDFSLENADEIHKQSAMISKEDLLNYIGIFSELQGRMKFALNERILLEVTCMKLCRQILPSDGGSDGGTDNFSDIMEKMARLEDELTKMKSQPVLSQIPNPSVPSKIKNPTPDISPKTDAIPDKVKHADKIIETWDSFISFLKSEGEMALFCYMDNVNPRSLTNSLLTIECDNSAYDYMKKNKDKLVKLLCKKYHTEIDLKIEKKVDTSNVDKNSSLERFTQNLNWNL